MKFSAAFIAASLVVAASAAPMPQNQGNNNGQWNYGSNQGNGNGVGNTGSNQGNGNGNSNTGYFGVWGPGGTKSGNSNGVGNFGASNGNGNGNSNLVIRTATKMAALTGESAMEIRMETVTTVPRPVQRTVTTTSA